MNTDYKGVVQALRCAADALWFYERATWPECQKARMVLKMVVRPMLEEIEAKGLAKNEEAPAMTAEEQRQEEVAMILYSVHSEAVGWKDAKGDPLPKWVGLVEDSEKKTLANGWRAAAKVVLRQYVKGENK